MKTNQGVQCATFLLLYPAASTQHEFSMNGNLTNDDNAIGGRYDELETIQNLLCMSQSQDLYVKLRIVGR
jgi:hypothetical protein